MYSSKTKKIFGLPPGLPAFFLFSLAFLLAGCLDQTGKPVGPVGEAGLLGVIVSVNNGSGVVSKTVYVKNGSTAFDAFKAAANLSYTMHPVYGIYVTGINGLLEDSKTGKYWQYYVDGQLAPVGVSSFLLTKNVSLEFRYEAPAFG